MGRLRNRATRVFLLLAVSLAGGATASRGAEVASDPISQVAQADQAILERSETKFVADLSATARCSLEQLGQGIGTFSWKLVEPIGSQYRVDVSMFRDGLRTGRFETIGVLPPERTSVEWLGGRAGVNYRWRVLARTSEGWLPSPTARFIGPVCPVDYQDEPKTEEKPQ